MMKYAYYNEEFIFFTNKGVEDKVGNSIFYVDDQQEFPADEQRGNLNMISAAYEVRCVESFAFIFMLLSHI